MAAIVSLREVVEALDFNRRKKKRWPSFAAGCVSLADHAFHPIELVDFRFRLVSALCADLPRLVARKGQERGNVSEPRGCCTSIARNRWASAKSSTETCQAAQEHAKRSEVRSTRSPCRRAVTALLGATAGLPAHPRRHRQWYSIGDSASANALADCRATRTRTPRSVREFWAARYSMFSRMTTPKAS